MRKPHIFFLYGNWCVAAMPPPYTRKELFLFWDAKDWCNYQNLKAIK